MHFIRRKVGFFLVWVTALCPIFHYSISADATEAEIDMIEPKFGPEFTFTNHDLISASGLSGEIITSPANGAARNQWFQLMKKKCAVVGCTYQFLKIRNFPITIRFTYPDGFHYNLSLDPGVIEIQMKPLTLKETIQYSSRIQSDIFDVATQIHLAPDDYYGGGSIHVDKKTGFRDNPLLFLDFVVDYSNHYTLSTDSLGEYLDNAPPILALPRVNQENFAKVIENARSSREKTIEKISKEIIEQVYTANPYNFTPTAKYQALNLNKMLRPNESERTVEIKGIRAQKDVGEYIALLRIFRARINFLYQRRLHGFGDVLWLGITKPETTFNESMKSKSHYKLVATQFKRYLEETGLLWHGFRHLLRPPTLLSPPTPLNEDTECLSNKDLCFPQDQFLKNMETLRSKL